MERGTLALKAGLKIETPAVTVNRLCGSGIEAIVQAGQRLLLGEANMVLAGGMENMTQAPFVIRGARTGLKLGGGRVGRFSFCRADGYLLRIADGVDRGKIGGANGDHAQGLGCIRVAQPAGSGCCSEGGLFKEEIVPVEVKQGKKAIVVSEDDHRRPETTMETLEKLPPSFKKDGIVTAGNASGIVDGAAAVVVTREKTAKERG